MRPGINVLKKFSVATAVIFVLTISPAVFAESVQVNVTDNSFSPKEVTIPTGGSVRWMNTGSMTHTVTFETEDVFDSGNLAPGFSTSHTFNTPGTYRYFCQYDGAPGGQGMSGTIIVTGAAGASSASSTNATSSSATSASYSATSTNQQYATSSYAQNSYGYPPQNYQPYPPQNYQPYPPQQQTQNPQVPNTGGQPYVSLNNVPYTGFDLGPAGDALYALLMGIFFLSLGYLTFYYARVFYTRS